ncbi:MAG: hypothetical protein EAX86_13555 [Candidatus Heimdallarchaeota archaeon]|nr:hypothetical protein [Candidatus Heimdallarchaeota archaeon]
MSTKSRSLVASLTYLALHLISMNEKLGRYKLSQTLEISEAQARTILCNLASRGLIEKSSKRHGHKLTEDGQRFLNKCQQYIYIPPKRIHLGKKYTVGLKDAAVGVEATGIDQLNTVVLRDESLINGASGCTVFLKDEFEEIYLLGAVYPPKPDISLSDRKIKRKLARLFHESDWTDIIMVVGSGESVASAQVGAISAALLLVPIYIKEKIRGISN